MHDPNFVTEQGIKQGRCDRWVREGSIPPPYISEVWKFEQQVGKF